MRHPRREAFVNLCPRATDTSGMTLPAFGAPRPDVAPAASAARLTDPQRLDVLRQCGLLHGTANPVLDGLARITTHVLAVPMAFVSLVDDRRQHLPGLAGVTHWAGEARGTPLSHAFAQFVVVRDQTVVIGDLASDDTAREHPGFSELGARAFAGAPIRLEGGEVVGALCAVHTMPMDWRPDHVARLEDLAAAAVAEIERLVTGQKLARAEAAQREQGERDTLTGLLNRRGFGEAVRHHLALAQRTGAAFTVATIDLDRFRFLNEVFGPDAGDQALIDVAEVLRTVCRDADLCARLRADEFGVLLCNTSQAEAEIFERRLQAALVAGNAAPGREYALHASVGLATWTAETPRTFATLLRVAEESMRIEKGQRAEGKVDCV